MTHIFEQVLWQRDVLSLQGGMPVLESLAGPAATTIIAWPFFAGGTWIFDGRHLQFSGLIVCHGA